jgi:hypothetical protein
MYPKHTKNHTLTSELSPAPLQQLDQQSQKMQERARKQRRTSSRVVENLPELSVNDLISTPPAARLLYSPRVDESTQTVDQLRKRKTLSG